MSEGIFAGLRVLDFSNVLSGPSMTRLFTELGAEVIKVELPPSGDVARALPWVKNGRSGYHVQQNRGKRSLFIDAKDPRGREIVLDLVDGVDVLVQNFSPGAIERLGLGWDVVSARNPRLVMCSISAFGPTGPLADQPGYDPIAQAYTGVTHMIGEADRAPAMLGVSPGDVMTGVYGFGAVAAALYHRERTGKGQLVEVSLADTYMSCHEVNLQASSLSDGTLAPHRAGSIHPVVGGIGVFATADGYVSIAVVNDRQWVQFCRAIDRPDLEHDERFAVAVARTANREALNGLIEQWLASQPDRDAAVAVLAAERVPCAPVLDIAEAAAHPHMRECGVVRTVVDDKVGEVTVPGVPMRFSSHPEPLELHTVELGADNHDIVCSLAGLDEAHYQSLVTAGVLRHDPNS